MPSTSMVAGMKMRTTVCHVITIYSINTCSILFLSVLSFIVDIDTFSLDKWLVPTRTAMKQAACGGVPRWARGSVRSRRPWARRWHRDGGCGCGEAWLVAADCGGGAVGTGGSITAPLAPLPTGRGRCVAGVGAPGRLPGLGGEGGGWGAEWRRNQWAGTQTASARGGGGDRGMAGSGAGRRRRLAAAAAAAGRQRLAWRRGWEGGGAVKGGAAVAAPPRPPIEANGRAGRRRPP